MTTPLLKDFPINDLLSATEMDRIRTAVQGIFNHLRMNRNTKNPIQRALRLVESISRDVSSQLLKVLGTRRLMYIPYEEFEKVMSQCHEVFTTWDDKLRGLMVDIVKKKRCDHLKMVWRVNLTYKRLQERMQHMVKFRRQHEQLRTVIAQHISQTHQLEVKPEAIALETADANAIEEVNLADQNAGSWCPIITKVGSANEMFRIFSRFNALFIRPHTMEYQTQLIQRVNDDIETLREKFKVQYMQSMRVEDVLYEGWANHVEGQTLTETL